MEKKQRFFAIVKGVNKKSADAKNEGVAEYEAEIELSQGPKTKWLIKYTGKELEILHSKLTKAAGKGVRLPELVVLEGSSSEKMLQKYLNDLLQLTALHYTEPFQQFVSREEAHGLKRENGGVYVVRSTQDVKKLVQWLQKSKRDLREVIFYFMDCRLQDAGAEQITRDGLAHLTGLRILTLTLMKNRIGFSGVEYIALQGLRRMSHLHTLTLNLQDNGIGDRGFEVILNVALQAMVMLKNLTLQLGFNTLSDRAMELFGSTQGKQVLDRLFRFRLFVEGNTITEKGCLHLAEALAHSSNMHLLLLNFVQNKIGITGVAHLTVQGVARMLPILSQVDLYLEPTLQEDCEPLTELVEKHVKRRGRAMLLLKLILKMREKMYEKFFRKEIYTSELVGQFLV